MNRTFPIPSLSWFRNRQISLAEIGNLIDLFPRAAILIDLQQQRIVLANAAMTEMTAFTRSELASQNLGILLPVLADRRAQGLPTTSSEVFSDQLQSRNGSPLEVRVSFHLLNQPGTWAIASVESLAVYQQDLEDHKRHQERLNALLALVQCPLEGEIDHSLQTTLDIGHRLTGASHLSLYLVEASEPELHRITVWGPDYQLPEIITPDEAWQIAEPQLWIPGRRATNDLHRAARKMKLSYLASHPIGEHPAIVGMLVLADQGGKPLEDFEVLTGILAATTSGIIQQKTFKDHIISDERKTNRKFQIYGSFIESSQEGLLVLTPDLRIDEMNPAAENLLGYAAREVCGHTIGDVMIGPANLIPALQAAQGGIPTPNLGEVRLVRRDGATFLAHVSTFPFILADKVEGIIVYFRDLSEHEQFEVRNQQLEQRALLGEVTAIFAHEVRNPINNISTGLQLMSMNLPKDDPNQELIGRLTHDCNRLTHLMQSVLTFSKPAENSTHVVDLNELLPAIIERWRPRLGRFNIKHEVHPSTENASILGDPRALEQVFNNLVSNAIEAMKDISDGTITVNIRPAPSIASKEYVEVSVIDNGPGIPEDILDRIFDPFVTSNPNGTGLGLSIAKRIVNKHKGTIGVTSVPGGTVFQCTFPVAVLNED